jgi:hypothetical protein
MRVTVIKLVNITNLQRNFDRLNKYSSKISKLYLKKMDHSNVKYKWILWIVGFNLNVSFKEGVNILSWIN